MSISSLVQVFESGTNAAPHRGALLLDELIQRSLEAAKNNIVADALPGHSKESKSVIRETGEYLSQLAKILSQLTETLVQGPHVETAIVEAHERAHLKNSTSDLYPISTMDVECTKLQRIDELTQKFCRDVQSIWNEGPPMVPVDSPSQHSSFSPFREPRRPSIKRSPSVVGDVDFKLSSIQSTLPSPQGQPGLISPNLNASESDDSSDEDEKFSNIDMDALRQRGKDSIVTNTGNRGGATFPVVQTHPKSASLPAETG